MPSEGDMPIEILIPTREAALQIFGRLSGGRIFGDPSKRLDFSLANVIFAYQPAQAAHDMRWLDASSRGAADSFRLALSWLPIELCTDRNFKWQALSDQGF
jgi:hypothetical protein